MHQKIRRAQRQATPLNKPLLNQLLSNSDNSLRGLRNKVLLRIGYKTVRQRSELRAFKFEDIDQTHNGKPIPKFNFSKTDQYGAGKVFPISDEILKLIDKWRGIVSEEGYILRATDRHDHITNNLNPARISAILETLQ